MVGIFFFLRVVDLNGDNIGDIIMGGGRVEFLVLDIVFFVLDGVIGKLFWYVLVFD